KMVLRFKTAFWEEDGFLARRLARARPEPPPLNFVHDLEQPIGTWRTPSPVMAPTLTAWTGGAKAERVLALELEAQLDQVLDSLAATFAVRRALLDDQLDGRWSHDWSADPWSRCGYSYPGVNGIPAQRVI